MSIVVVVAPHPDDETLGCGGTLLRHKANGDTIHWLIMTTISVEAGYSKDKVQSREAEIKKVSEAYGFASVHHASFISAELDRVPKKNLVGEISTLFYDVKPDTIYLPFCNDIHSDHEAVFDAVASCTKSFRYPFIKNVRVYETLSETEFNMRAGCDGFRPNLWVDITDYLSQKIEIMNLYEGEMGTHPFPRSERAIRSQACLRGARTGLHAAEAFMILEEII